MFFLFAVFLLFKIKKSFICRFQFEIFNFLLYTSLGDLYILNLLKCNVPEEYHEFADVFSKAKAGSLAPHHPYDLKINLEEGASPPINPMYSLSQSKLTTLQEFINKHLWIGFIHPTNSPHRAPVLFVWKKDGSLRLCVDFKGTQQNL